MKKQILVCAAAFTAAASLMLGSCELPSYPSASAVKAGTDASVTLTDYTYNISAAAVGTSFMRGVDASEVKALEESGQKWYDENGIEKDVFSILADHGVNWIRLRIWNDYTQALDDEWGPYGFNNLSRTINMAQRAKKYGMKVLLDFHYSDTWADPSSQECPAAWSKIKTADELAAAVGEYTSDVIAAMLENDCAPDMVQLGNEMQGGLFQTGSSVLLAPLYTAQYVKAGAEAVKALLPDAELMLHMSNGDKAAYLSLIEAISDAVTDADGNKLITAIGVSYYSFLHGTDTDLKANLEKIKADGYKVVIAENSYGYSTSAYTDSTNNEFWTDDEVTSAEKLTGYNKGTGITARTTTSGTTTTTEKIIEASVENQAGVMQYLMEMVSAIDAEGGYFYWGGCYLGIQDEVNSTWENQALFDASGKVLPSVDSFNVK